MCFIFLGCIKLGCELDFEIIWPKVHTTDLTSLARFVPVESNIH